MDSTALQVRAEGLRAGFAGYKDGEYRGAVAATRFSDPGTEFAKLRSECGVYDLGYRAKISLTGGDRVRWLNGMVTNNIRDLATGHGVYAFLLNPQGRILGDLYAYNRGESIVVDTDRSQMEKILATFDHYIIMDDVEVKDLSEQFTTLGISGPKALEILRNAGIEFPALQPLQFHDTQCDCECGCLNCTIVRRDSELESYEIWVEPAYVEAAVELADCKGGDACGLRSAGIAATGIGNSSLWHRHPGTRSATGNGTGPCPELQQGMLHRAGNCGADSLARRGASKVLRISC